LTFYGGELGGVWEVWLLHDSLEVMVGGSAGGWRRRAWYINGGK